MVKHAPVAPILCRPASHLRVRTASAGDRARAPRVDSLRHGEYELIALGARLGMDGRIPEALAMFEVNVELYPEAPNAWTRLARRCSWCRAVMMRGRHSRARSSLPRSQGILAFRSSARSSSV